MACMMVSMDWIRYQEMLDHGVPEALALACARHRVWKKQWDNVTVSWVEGQDRDLIPDLDWIEF